MRNEMITWEDKDTDNKTWVALQEYFTKIYQKNQRYGGTSAQGHGYREAVHGAAEKEQHPGNIFKEAMKEVALAATADKEHIQQMLDTADDILTIVKQQQGTIEKQAQQISNLIDKNGKYADIIRKFESNKPPPQRTRDGRGHGGKQEKSRHVAGAEPPVCAICKDHHPTMDCWELEKNKDKRPTNWKSKFE